MHVGVLIQADRDGVLESVGKQQLLSIASHHSGSFELTYNVLHIDPKHKMFPSSSYNKLNILESLIFTQDNSFL